ncbi:MAG: TVP38/TMEM64 family protein [Christensenellales bacterium]
MNRKKGIRILLTVLTAAALLAAGGYALWKNGFFEKINSVEALREVIAGTGMWAGGVYFALQMMTVIIAPIPSNISMMAGALALGFWPAMILGVLAVGVGSVIVFLAARALGKKAVQRFLDKGVMDKYLPIIEEKQDMFLFLTMLFPLLSGRRAVHAGGTDEYPARPVCRHHGAEQAVGVDCRGADGQRIDQPADLGVGSHRRRRPVHFLFRDEIQRAD